jgi:PhnB protein
MKTFIEPWLTVQGGATAIEFYKNAFDATEVFHLEDPDRNVVSRLSINGATFWLSDGPAKEHKEDVAVRMILTVDDPDTFFAQVIRAGAEEVFPVSEEHGWRVGRLVDPFGHHWEIGKQVSE